MTYEPPQLHIADYHIAWLKEMATKHSLPDEHKALRVVLEFAMQDGDEKDIFEEIRCHNC